MDIKELERKTLEVKFIKSSFSEDDKYYYLAGYGSTFDNVDRGNDVVKQGAFAASLKEMSPKFCYQHDMQDPLGVFTKLQEDHNGLAFEAKMRKGFEKTRWIAGLIEDGAIDSMSIGYGTVKSSYDSKSEVRYLEELKLYEISLVTLPMNPKAQITAFKSLNPNFIEKIKSAREIETILKEAGFSVREAKTIISKAKEFGSCDESKQHCDDAKPVDISPLLEEIKFFNTIIQSKNI